MLKSILFILVFCVTCTITNSQSVDILKLYKSTFFGGTGGAACTIRDIVTDAQGYVYLTGSARNIPVTQGAYQTTFGGGSDDGFIAKFSPDLSTLIWSTYLGGSSNDWATSLAVGSDGSVFIAGSASSNFPLTNSNDVGILSQMLASTTDGAPVFVARLSADGSQLLYSRVVCGSQFGGTYPRASDLGISHTINAQNEAVVYCYVRDGNFTRITNNAYQSTVSGSSDLCITKFSASGDVLYCSYYGGNGLDVTGRISYANGKFFMSGGTRSQNFPLATGKAVGTLYDCFVLVWNDGAVPTPQGAYIYGSVNDDYSNEIRYNNATGKIIVDGFTAGSDMPYTNVLQNGQNTGGFVASINSDLSGIDYLTMLGTYLNPFGLRTLSNGDVYVSSWIYPGVASAFITNGAFQPNNAGQYEQAINGLTPTGQARYGTYLGGSNREHSTYLSIIENGSCSFKLVVGTMTVSANYPVTAGSYMPSWPGNNASAITILSKTNPDSTIISPGASCGEYMFQGTSTGVAPCGAVNYFYNFGDGTAV
ncbi:MAG: SBBP repeat-containing protein, partial [Bacteriodetes bacterium]|nr:SBBP repeat-containing protein [Bacteroidota bacterium]